jgi:hypothetical protein
VIVFFSLVVRSAWPRRILVAASIACTVALLGFLLVFFGPLRCAENLLPNQMRPAFDSILADPRVTETAVAMRMFRAAPWLGTGLNSYGDMNAALNPGRFVSYYAHNDYAQLLAETGVVGGAVAAALGLLFLARFRRFLGQPTLDDPELAAAAWAAAAGLAVHSFFDWNLHLPANAFLASLTAGVAISSGEPVVVATRAADRSTDMRGRALSWCLSGAYLVAFLFLARDALTEQKQFNLRTAVAADRIRARMPGHPVPTADLDVAIAAGERMAAWDCYNPRLTLLLAQAHVHAAGLCIDKAAKDGVEQAASAWCQKTRSLGPKLIGLPELRSSATPTSPKPDPLH